MEETTQENKEIRKAVTAVVYDKMHKPYFLIMKRIKNWEGWEFVKGGINKGETEEDAVKREIIKETGLQEFKIIKKLDNVKKEFVGIGDKLNVHSVYLVESNMNIPIHVPQGEDKEHSTYLWADVDSVRSKLTWDNDKEILERVLEEFK